MKRSDFETLILSLIVVWTTFEILTRSVPSTLNATMLVTIAISSLLLDRLHISAVLETLFTSRPFASPGLGLGVITLPIVYASKLHHEAMTNAAHSGNSQLHFWLFLVCGAGMLGGNIALWSTSPTATNGRSSEKKNTSSPGNSLQTWTWLTGWTAASLGAAFFAVLASDWSGPLWTWLATGSATCGALLLYLSHAFPSCATPGEALLVSEGLTIVAMDAAAKTAAKLFPAMAAHPLIARGLTSGPPSDIAAVVQGLLLAVVLLPVLWLALRAAACRLVTPNGKPNGKLNGWLHSATFYAASAVALFGLFPTWTCQVAGLRKHPFLWAVDFLMENAALRLALLSYWLLVALLPLGSLRQLAAEGRVPRILLRKLYHAMAVLLFAPPIVLQEPLLSLAFGGALAAFVLAEVVRVGRVPPCDSLLDDFLRAFTDSRDSGKLILSHFSLLLGCALPLWLTPHSTKLSLAPFAGVLSLGIGDTMASVVGYQFGKIRLCSDSRKTVEGTLASILSMLLFIVLLTPFLPCFNIRQLTGIVAATIIASFVEASTMQLDNAFVPLIYWALLCLSGV